MCWLCLERNGRIADAYTVSERAKGRREIESRRNFCPVVWRRGFIGGRWWSCPFVSHCAVWLYFRIPFHYVSPFANNLASFSSITFHLNICIDHTTIEVCLHHFPLLRYLISRRKSIVYLEKPGLYRAWGHSNINTSMYEPSSRRPRRLPAINTIFEHLPWAVSRKRGWETGITLCEAVQMKPKLRYRYYPRFWTNAEGTISLSERKCIILLKESLWCGNFGHVAVPMSPNSKSQWRSLPLINV